MKKSLYSVLITLSLTAPQVSQLNAKELTIFYTNDMHAHVSPAPVPALDKTRPVGGFATVSGIVKQAMKNNKGVFFFDAGDYFTGPYISTLTKGEAIIDIMNTMPYDAVSIGNHEFDHGEDNLIRQVSKLKFPVLLDNVFYIKSGKPFWDKPYAIVEKDGIKIGVIGAHGVSAFYEAIAAGVRQDVEARDPIPIIRKTVSELKDKVDLIVLLIHEGVPGRQSSFGNADVARMLQEDINTAGKIPGVDVLITGHAHVGTPTPIKVNNTLVVSTDAYTTNLGKLVLDYNPVTKKIDSYNGKLITLYSDTYKPDPETQKKIDEWDQKLKTITQKVIGQSTGIFTRAYGESSPVGNFVNDAILAKVPGAVAAFSNSGGLRADLPKGNITIGDIVTMFPFINDIIEMDITGKDLKQAVSHGADLKNGVLQVSKSVLVRYDSSKQPGQRVVEFSINGQPVEDNKIYHIAVDSFCANGGGGFLSFKNGKNVKTLTGMQKSQIIIDRIAELHTIEPDNSKRTADISKR
ncbi:bifunctional metallophosphatase/5'-nucleotidase [Salmonella enterica]|nr:bifunctional metallophosphatase/5'-nucleotidase [Salmonella enterica subsp. salamae]EKP5053624.1 bifunctional metallophosphatase/5'-nucleotidase [Salmonella enterica]